MAFLYGCEPNTEGLIPESHPMFSCRNLQLTHDLLREQEPALANQLHQLLRQTEQHINSEIPPDHCQIGFYPLINELGAQSVSSIIANLTALGSQWLKQPPPSQASATSLKQLLDEWIELGDWLVRTAAVH
ncbi:hypothetical protein [Gilvimarinus agarilyticus]|uniref:hypothetical protein n=1 Tax=Gilvimarinus agarilyticus TaxID=679259 RepID=UPI0005A02286|nr:hypothetical protein [Gilvimarinus agarilyticus]